MSIGISFDEARHLFDRMVIRLIHWAAVREPSFIVGGADNPYLLRWYLTPWRGWYRQVSKDERTWWHSAVIWVSRWLPNVYLHRFNRSDDDRALHDHPWLCNASLLIFGSYTEHTIDRGGIHRRTVRKAGQLAFRWGRAPHRIELHDGPCWTVFITAPVVRNWGFHCPDGWVPWEVFTDPADPGRSGRGCGDQP